MPKVSVIIPTYNRSHLIYRSIQSVLNQTYQDFEIIVVDDGSTDNTEDVIRNFKDSRIKFVKSQNNRGASAARNTGVELAKGEYIAFQDSDDEWLPEKLEKQIEAFGIVPPEVGIIYTDMLRINKDGAIEYWHSPTLTYGHLINPRTMDYQAMEIGIISTLIKKECFDRVGNFDENFPRLEDMEFFTRLVKHYHFHLIKEPLAKYYATEGVSSNIPAIPIARKLLLEKYFKELEINRIFLANQYFRCGYAFQSCGRFTEAKSYFRKAFKEKPLNVKYMLIFIISSLGQKIFGTIIKFYRGIKNID